MIYPFFEAAALAFSVSVDTFAAGFAYGCDKTKIPLPSVLVISSICSGILGVSLLAGRCILPWIPSTLTAGLSFSILLLLGIVKLLDGITKSFIRKHNKMNKERLLKEMHFSLFNIKFIVNLYANPAEADVDSSKVISPREAAALAVSLSLDGFAVGFGAVLGKAPALPVFLATLAANILAVKLGSLIGNRLACKSQLDLSWLGGAALLCLAFVRLV